MERKPTPEEYEEALNELRMVVLMECEGGHFHQIMLTDTQYQKLSALTSFPMAPDEDDDLEEGMEMRGMNVKHDFALDADALLGCASTYTEQEIAASRAAIKEEANEEDDDDEI